ncbi:Uncharacterized protein PBTT_05305 [Plasmodiophora brassicae]
MPRVVGNRAVLFMCLTAIAGQLALAGWSVGPSASNEIVKHRLKMAAAAKTVSLIMTRLRPTGLADPRRFRPKDPSTLTKTRDYLDVAANTAVVDAGAELITGFVESQADVPHKIKGHLRNRHIRAGVRAAAGGLVAQGLGFDGKQHFINSLLLHALVHIASSAP